MHVLLLGPSPSPLAPVLEKYGCRLTEWSETIDADFLWKRGIEFAVSYRYRHVVKKDIIEYLQGNIINLHISLLPWNRGADPNLWSFLEDTPKGFTIHYIDEGVDTGDIIVQQEVFFDTAEETLATTYEKLNAGITGLLNHEWSNILSGKAVRMKQPLGGSVHQSRDKIKFMPLLSAKGWDTPVAEIVGKALNDPEKVSHAPASNQ